VGTTEAMGTFVFAQGKEDKYPLGAVGSLDELRTFPLAARSLDEFVLGLGSKNFKGKKKYPMPGL